MKKILVAEDNLANRELIREILEAGGYEVVEACDGREALEKIAEAMPDLVLLDIQMPILDGFAIVRQLRENPRFTDLPVVALTAFAMRGDRERALAAGFTAYLTKPFDLQLLRTQIAQILRSSSSVP